LFVSQKGLLLYPLLNFPKFFMRNHQET